MKNMEVFASNHNLNKIEALLRFFALLILLLAAVVMGTDKQTKVYFGAYKQKVNFKLAYILEISMYVYSVGAGYSLLQLLRCLTFTNNEENKLSWSNHILKWIYFMLDQVAVYVVFAIACASIEIGVLALTGNKDLEWMELCNKYVRFCVQFGGSLACGLTSFILLAIISSLSTFKLFRWYSPNFLCLKPKKIGVYATTTSSGNSI